MDGPRDCYTEWSKSDTERQASYDITHMWNLKEKVLQVILKRKWVTDVSDEHKVTSGESGVQINWETGIDYTYYY